MYNLPVRGTSFKNKHQYTKQKTWSAECWQASQCAGKNHSVSFGKKVVALALMSASRTSGPTKIVSIAWKLLIPTSCSYQGHQFGLKNNIGTENDVTARRNTKHVTVTPLMFLPAFGEGYVGLAADDVRVTIGMVTLTSSAARPTYPSPKAGRNIWQSWWSHTRCCHHRHPTHRALTTCRWPFQAALTRGVIPSSVLALSLINLPQKSRC